ncbi:hypothetical protein ABER99_21700 [Paenibacillus glucanolyticus]|jgi:hypothetical protein|uniref:Uncharacterized protein n=1 Tax=Paenibacillus glucanolyticus TaxID=59843 RepID=A0A163GRL0_9BACL|nr:hypothetical protein [Paenibacillus glucanolyticus]KZS45114.1 hypothetical protein AWU65_03795 [Paenibacillus glucanolyticus]OMF63856.1 hypothetical protein BK142_32455 [Paenibacillus glucanolyticus]
MDKEFKDMTWKELIAFFTSEYLIPGAGDYIAGEIVTRLIAEIMPNKESWEEKFLEALYELPNLIAQKIEENDLRNYLAYVRNVMEQIINYGTTKDKTKLDDIEAEAQKAVTLLASLGRKGVTGLALAMTHHLLVIKIISTDYKPDYSKLLGIKAKAYKKEIKVAVDQILEEESKWLGEIQFMEVMMPLDMQVEERVRRTGINLPVQDSYKQGFYMFRFKHETESFISEFGYSLIDFEAERIEEAKINIEQKWNEYKSTLLVEHLEPFKELHADLIAVVDNWGNFPIE